MWRNLCDKNNILDRILVVSTYHRIILRTNISYEDAEVRVVFLVIVVNSTSIGGPKKGARCTTHGNGEREKENYAMGPLPAIKTSTVCTDGCFEAG